VIVGSLDRPNDKLLPLVFLADVARDLGARRVGLVAPYLAYMRQDTRFHAGEAITSRSFASVLSAHIDWLITVDPHLHRFASLQDVYSIPAMAIHASVELGRWIAEHVPAPLIIGPDEESRQWVDVIAATASAPSTVLSKVRRGDTDVVESIPNLEGHRSRTPVLVDDIISTGETMVAAIRHLREQAPKSRFASRCMLCSLVTRSARSQTRAHRESLPRTQFCIRRTRSTLCPSSQMRFRTRQARGVVLTIAADRHDWSSFAVAEEEKPHRLVREGPCQKNSRTS
jgi:ribose-phosphate pyrophosphokinase